MTVVTSPAAVSSVTAQSNLKVEPVCIGHGLDAWSSGLIATVVLSSVVGLLLWVSGLAAFMRQAKNLLPVNIRNNPTPVSPNLWSQRVVSSTTVRLFSGCDIKL
jgi:hypothetical protein